MMIAWILPFLGLAALVVGGLSVLVVEYQDQRLRRFGVARRGM